MKGDGARDDPGAQHAEEALIRTRRAKAERMRARGEDPFASRLDPPGREEMSSVRARHEGAKGPEGRYDPARVPPERHHVSGRVLFVRTFGAVTFVRLRDRTGELQVYATEERLGARYAELLGDLDLGDFLDVVGTAMATQKGELSVEAERLRVLTKAYRPLPTKTSFRDVESRYRMRYVDLVANPQVASVFRARALIVRALREFLDARGHLEVETSTMHAVLGGAAARPFETRHNALDLRLFLRIAPELFLKRLLVGGLERVYEIGRCYRNEGISTRHNPEFTMLEFYEAYATYEALMDVTEAMLRHADARLAAAMPAEHAAWSSERRFSLERFQRVPLADAVAAALARAGLPPEVLSRIAEPDAPVKEWAAAARRAGREVDWANFRKGALKAESPGERLFCAYEYLAEPFLAMDYRDDSGEKSAPVFLIDYPAETSPLARRKDGDPSLVDRFELFVDGRELCNAFSELNDPDEQAARFREQVARRARGDEQAMDYDEDYIRALEHGMPPAAGFGMGIDRLTMLLTNAPSIRDVILFPLLRPEGR